MSRSPTHDLSDLRNYLYSRAEWMWQGSLAITGIVLALTLWGFWSNSPNWLSITGLAAIIAPIVVAWQREAASQLVVRGDKCRRLILYADGFGREIASSELAEARAWGLGVNTDAAPFIRPYYSSKETPGPRRLADIVTESAFFTKQLAAKVRAGLTGAFILAIAAAVAALYLADLVSNTGLPGLLVAAKSVATFIAFLISGDFLLLMKKYSDLEQEAGRAYERCARLRIQLDLHEDEVISVVEDYGVALLQCPPIPMWLYLRYRDALNDVYRRSHRQ